MAVVSARQRTAAKVRVAVPTGAATPVQCPLCKSIDIYWNRAGDIYCRPCGRYVRTAAER